MADRVADRFVTAMLFKTQDAYDAYLKKYPHADRSKHRVQAPSTSPKADKSTQSPSKPKSESKPEPTKSPKESTSKLKASKADLKDALGVAKEWGTNTSQYRFDGIDKYFEDAESIKPKKLNLKDVGIFADHGRRVSEKNLDNPIIVLKMPNGRYQTLDGQHRVLTRKDKKLDDVDAIIIEVPWEKGAKRNGVSRYYIKRS